MDPNSVINFWFKELEPTQWWKKDSSLDKEIEKRFLNTLRAAAYGELFEWRSNAIGRLAEIIVLDQFSRNIFRNSPESFSQDSLALILSQEAVRQNSLSELADNQKPFLIMPFMHSESRAIHKEALKLFTSLGSESNLNFELKHKAIIDRFGRYPHRNEILRRESTKEEIEFLSQPGSSF